MRLYIKLSRNKERIPFNYQHLLTGVVHKWIGDRNEEHGRPSLYSFSWIQNTRAIKDGINLTRDSYFFISAYDELLIKKIVRGIMARPETFCGSIASEVQITSTPEFGDKERFMLNSPILIRKKEGEKVRHITFKDEDFASLLTESLVNKMKIAGLNFKGIRVSLDQDYPSPQTKLVDYNGIKNKTTLAPVIIQGEPEQIAFAWNVGLGNSTGIGFGALK